LCILKYAYMVYYINIYNWLMYRYFLFDVSKRFVVKNWNPS